MSERDIKLAFDPRPSVQWPHGYWYATAGTAGSVDYDAAAATPLDALYVLAKVLLEQIES